MAATNMADNTREKIGIVLSDADQLKSAMHTPIIEFSDFISRFRKIRRDLEVISFTSTYTDSY